MIASAAAATAEVTAAAATAPAAAFCQPAAPTARAALARAIRFFHRYDSCRSPRLRRPGRRRLCVPPLAPSPSLLP